MTIAGGAASPAELLAETQALQQQVKGLADQLTGMSALTGRNPNAFGSAAMAAVGTVIHHGKGINGGFASTGQFFKAVQAHYHPESIPSDQLPGYKSLMAGWRNDFETRIKANSPSGINESFSAADGGVLVPPDIVRQILMRMYSNDLLSRCTVFPVSGNSLKVPAINETSRADGSRFGGVTSYWRREQATVSPSKPSLMTVDLSLDSLMIFMVVTDEMMQDTGGALEVYLTQIAASEIQFKLGDAIVNGDGQGKPLGIMNSPAKVVQAAEAAGNASASGTGFITANATKMFSRLHVSCRPTSIWLYDQSMEPNLWALTIGTAGGSLAVFLPPGGLSSSAYATLIGRPMVATEFQKPIGTEGDIILFDPTQYIVATKGGIQTAVSMHLYFDSNALAFRWIIRMDGKPWWLKPLSPKSGGPTQSCIVTLASR